MPRILVADDEAANILVIKHALRGAFEVVQARTGAAVLERAARGDIDLIMLDIVMPELDGLEVCRRLKKNPLTHTIPVIFVTSLNESIDEARGFEAGAVDYITKPIDSEIVRARVRAHADSKRTHDLLEQLALVDPLTGVANRRRFDAALDEEWRRTRRACRWLSLAIVDVDQFKQFNDRHGHIAGDERLRTIADSIAKSARRAGDVVARYGGEEFGLILPEVEPARMLIVVRTLLNGVMAASADQVAAGSDAVTVSVGAISVVPPRGATVTAALSTADVLLYEAKESGRDRGVHLDFSTQVKTTIIRGPGTT
jgi:diguanylate cyclase (GGDEF)-like protein